MGGGDRSFSTNWPRNWRTRESLPAGLGRSSEVGDGEAGEPTDPVGVGLADRE